MKRRHFIKSIAMITTASSCACISRSTITGSKEIQIASFKTAFEKEALKGKFGFKGNYLTELWQVVSKITSARGFSGTGLATQSVLYADADLFARHSEQAGNKFMYELTRDALKIASQKTFTSPIELLDKILPEVYDSAKSITGKKDLDVNFLYNSLVSVDNATWMLYARENGFNNFDKMIPDLYKKALSNRNNKLALLFLVTYNMPVNDIKKAVNDGYFVIKIKTGQPGSQQEMLQKDIDRLTEIHNSLKNIITPHTASGKVFYTMDANGRYEKKETLGRYLDHAKKIGAFDQILVYEEPLAMNNNENVSDLGIRIGADESIHTEVDAIKKIDLGYGAMVLKGIAKTLSQSMKIAKIAFDNNIPCLCADLTVNPILIDWHKNLAARLQPFPKLGMGLMETNGNINYVNWENMLKRHPCYGADWTKIKNGGFELTSDFYKTSGGIFLESEHYKKMRSFQE